MFTNALQGRLLAAVAKKVLSEEERSAELEAWREFAESKIDERADQMSDRVPLQVRKQQAAEEVEGRYAQQKELLGL